MKEEAPSLPLGSRLLNGGHTQEALVCFLEVRDEYRQTNDGSSSAQIEQLLGICYRLLGRYDMAMRAFRIAFALTDDNVRRGSIDRDWAMVPFARGQYAVAHAALDSALELIAQSDPLEYAATMGFKARVYAREGDIVRANDYYRTVDGMIRRSDDGDQRKTTYELNNLVWWLKTVKGVRQRKKLAARAWELASAAGNRRRQVQIVLLLLCRPLATRVAG